MMRVSLVFPILLAMLTIVGAEELCDEQRKVIRRLHSAFHDNIDLHQTYLVYGNLEAINLRPRMLDEPLSLNSEFIQLVGTKDRYRRHSCLKQSVNPTTGKLHLFGWYTRAQDKGLIFGRFEESGQPIQEVGAVHRLIYDADPWNFSVASYGSIIDEEAVEGYFDRVCDLSSAISIRQLKGETIVVYQGNRMRAEVLYSDKFGGMPVLTRWYGAWTTIKPDAEPDDYFVYSQNVTRWGDFSGTWLPQKSQVEVYSPFSNGKKRNTDWTIDFHWVGKENIDVEKLAPLNSVQLLEFAKEHELKAKNQPSRRRRQ